MSLWLYEGDWNTITAINFHHAVNTYLLTFFTNLQRTSAKKITILFQILLYRQCAQVQILYVNICQYNVSLGFISAQLWLTLIDQPTPIGHF